MERFGWLRRYISPVFLALLVASFILWYIAKLNYTYTTEPVSYTHLRGQLHIDQYDDHRGFALYAAEMCIRDR